MSLIVDRQHQLLRLFVIANQLEGDARCTRQNLAEMCHCSVRTITRDLAFLREMGVHLEYDAAQRSYALGAPLPFQTMQFSLSEVMALATAQAVALSQKGSPFEAAMRATFARLIARLPPSLQDAIKATREVVSFSADLQRDYSQAPWQELMQAAQQRQTVEICYHSLGRDHLSFRKVDPYALIERSGYMLMVGYCHERREVREFALDRIRQLQNTGQVFSPELGFSHDDYMKGAVGALRGDPTSIVVRFDNVMAPYARRRQWQFPHEFEEVADGGLLLRGTVSGEKGIRNELLSWGSGVEVLEPTTLREAMRAEGQAIANKHCPKKS